MDSAQQEHVTSNITLAWRAGTTTRTNLPDGLLAQLPQCAEPQLALVSYSFLLTRAHSAQSRQLAACVRRGVMGTKSGKARGQ